VPLLLVLWTVLVLLALALDRRDGRRVAGAVLLAVAIHFVISEVLLKHLVLAELPMRVRPYLAHPDLITPVGHRFVDSSFPSSHAASTVAGGVDPGPRLRGAGDPRDRGARASPRRARRALIVDLSHRVGVGG